MSQVMSWPATRATMPGGAGRRALDCSGGGLGVGEPVRISGCARLPVPPRGDGALPLHPANASKASKHSICRQINTILQQRGEAQRKEYWASSVGCQASRLSHLPGAAAEQEQASDTQNDADRCRLGRGGGGGAQQRSEALGRKRGGVHRLGAD